MIVNQISVFLENQAGALSSFAHLMREHGIDMKALSIAEANDFGILRIIVDNEYAAANVLKEAGYICRITPVLVITVPDVSGSLARVLEVLGENNINIDYTYACPARVQEKARVILKVADIDKTSKILAANGLSVL